MTFDELSANAESQGGLLSECFKTLTEQGIRSFFDAFSAEWRCCPVEEKVRTLRSFERCGVSFANLLEIFQACYSDPSRNYIHEDLPLTMLTYRRFGYEPEMPYDIDAEMIFLECNRKSHP